MWMIVFWLKMTAVTCDLEGTTVHPYSYQFCWLLITFHSCLHSYKKQSQFLPSHPCPFSFGHLLRASDVFFSRSLGVKATSENLSCNTLFPQHRKQKENHSENTRELDLWSSETDEIQVVSAPQV